MTKIVLVQSRYVFYPIEQFLIRFFRKNVTLSPILSKIDGWLSWEKKIPPVKINDESWDGCWICGLRTGQCKPVEISKLTAVGNQWRCEKHKNFVVKEVKI